jgi:hypothetical protein
MTLAQQGGEIDPLKRRVDDPREGSLYPPRRSVGIPLGRFPSRFGPPPRVRQHLLHTENTPQSPPLNTTLTPGSVVTSDPHSSRTPDMASVPPLYIFPSSRRIDAAGTGSLGPRARSGTFQNFLAFTIYREI